MHSNCTVTPAVSDLGSGFVHVVSHQFLGIPVLQGDVVLVQGELCLYCR